MKERATVKERHHRVIGFYSLELEPQRQPRFPPRCASVTVANMAKTVSSSNHADEWHPARLIPAVGIRSQEEQEKRATSSLLAVMKAVPEFGHALVTPLGAPKGRISTYTELQ